MVPVGIDLSQRVARTSRIFWENCQRLGNKVFSTHIELSVFHSPQRTSELMEKAGRRWLRGAEQSCARRVTRPNNFLEYSSDLKKLSQGVQRG